MSTMSCNWLFLAGLVFIHGSIPLLARGLRLIIDSRFIIIYTLYILSIYYNKYKNMLNTTVINIKTDSKVKKEAQKVAADLGLSLSGVINGFLKQFIRTKTVIFTLDESLPSKYLLDSVKSAAEDRKKGETHAFKNNKAAIDFLDNQ